MISSIREVSAFGVIARIARLENGVEVIPMPEVENLLGVTHHNITQHLASYVSQTDKTPHVPVAVLRQYDMAARTGRPPRLITKQEFQYLVKKVNTPQAWSVYQELWGAAEAHIHGMDMGMPPWAAEFSERFNRIDENFSRIENVCRGLRDEVDELRATLNLLISDDDEKTIRTLIVRIKDKFNCDGRAVVGKVRGILNMASIYETPDTRKVINTLRNILGEGLSIVKENT